MANRKVCVSFLILIYTTCLHASRKPQTITYSEESGENPVFLKEIADINNELGLSDKNEIIKEEAVLNVGGRNRNPDTHLTTVRVFIKLTIGTFQCQRLRLFLKCR